LDEASALPLEEQEMLIGVLRKRQAEAWRRELAVDVRKARRDYRAGKLKAESVEQLSARLHLNLDEPGT
jgi:hypothetical protein